MKVTKKQAAIAQLETAIYLYFFDVDPISVHTLACASGEALDGICREKNVISSWQILMNMVIPEFRKEITDSLRESFNFFKHGSRPLGSVNFTDDQNLFYLFRACYNATSLSVDFQRITVFMTWLMAAVPEWLKVSTVPPGIIKSTYGDIAHLSRDVQKKSGKYLIVATSLSSFEGE